MSEPKAQIINSPEALRVAAAAWNRLCARSGETLPTSRAEMVALWSEHFRAPLAVFTVEHEGRLAAALPVAEGCRLGCRFGALTGNHWSVAGDFLIDPAGPVDRACDALVLGLRERAGSWLQLDLPGWSSARWQPLLAAFARAGTPLARHPRFRVNLVRLESDWQTYFGSRSRNHRRHLRRATVRANREGTIELICHHRLSARQVEPLLRTCFEIEASGWKGRERGAVLSTPGVWEFYLAQARLLAAAGQLRLVLLHLNGKPIAFEYGWVAGGTYCSPKVGYDEAHHRLAPGQLLRALWFERLFQEGDVHTINFFGPASAATSCWATHDAGVDRVVVAVGGTPSRALLAAYRGLRPALGAVRRWFRPVASPATPRKMPAVDRPDRVAPVADCAIGE